ncbi:MAG: hypothetical protein JWO38_1013 [Gemmataceae bacterium]|nr:hypothetical protein [Gemmataceae bacterium]
MDPEKELERIAQQYRDEGYAVATRPGRDQLPGFAAGFEVDLRADRGNEHVLVEVMRDRAALQADPAAGRLAEVTNAQPGWRYDVIVLEQDSPLQRIARMVGEPTPDQIEQILVEAEHVMRISSTRAGLVLAWAGLEAAMRRYAHRVGINGEVGTQPLTMIRELYAKGHFSREDYARLEVSRRLRAAVAHGLPPSSIDPGEVHTVIDMARRLLAESEKPQAVAG